MNRPILDLIGNTPLIRLDGPSRATGCEILGKAEFLNPGGSVKDRTALGIVRDAEARGLIAKGGTFVEGTAGNTGIGLATVAGALGYKSLIVMPRTQSPAKKDALLAAGAQVIEVDPAPFSSEHHFVHISRRLAGELNTTRGAAYWANQFDNPANKAFHAGTTGVEIWEQTGGRIDGFIASAGTGGSLAGVAQALRTRKPDVAIALADPAGGALYSYFTEGELKSEGSSITEGIGVGRLTGQLTDLAVDHAYRIQDEDFLPILFDLVATEGLSLGGSAGVNIAGAMRLARDLGPGKTIVTLLCDAGARYANRIYNADYLAARNLPVPPWSQAHAGLSTAV
ncbi:cysteine synthase A [Marinicauda pacifica]|uniref:Cysteine synthase A n=1 Tax=Marinicauda pacifica TaxID=1133559 RepID=A0A4S2HBF3_9PROT|nr:cysteine synthase A [Marinicauda pacifica]TGY93093.1 cysteine synthase A [Marinicauda pacifica]GGE42768.1 cysteine synthase A [Marinicauda pacifica]